MVQGHRFVAGTALGAVVLPAERDAAFIVGEEPGVGDGDSMRVARQVCEHCLGSSEGPLGVDDPLALSQRHEPVGKGLRIGQIDVLAKELQLPAPMQDLQLFEEASPEQAREHSDREEEPRLAWYPAVGVDCEAAAGHDAVHVRVVSQGRTPGVQDEGGADPGP